jgi:hypothetical protein
MPFGQFGHEMSPPDRRTPGIASAAFVLRRAAAAVGAEAKAAGAAAETAMAETAGAAAAADPAASVLVSSAQSRTATPARPRGSARTRRNMSAPDLGASPPILRIGPPEISGNGPPPMVAHVASSGATFSLSHAGHIVTFHDRMRGSARKLRLSPVFQMRKPRIRQS